MVSPRLRNHFGKVCALAATILILPVLAYAGKQDGDSQGQNYPRVPVVPEANPVWVLVPFFGAVLLLSSRHLFGAKASKDKA